MKKELIKAWEVLFEKYPNLIRLPVYAYGRYYKYEQAGEKFESCEETPYDLAQRCYENIFDLPLLKIISEENKDALWKGQIGDYTLNRKKVIKKFGGDDRGGQCLYIEKTKTGLQVFVTECDSPE